MWRMRAGAVHCCRAARAARRGALRVEVTLRPFAFTVRRDGRRLLRAGGYGSPTARSRPVRPVHRGRDRRTRSARRPSARCHAIVYARRRVRGRAEVRSTAAGRRKPDRGARGRRGWPRARRRRRPAAAGLRLGPPRRGAARRPGLRHHARLTRPGATSSSGRPPLHRPRLPARDARRGRRAAGRLRSAAVAALEPGLRGLVPHRCQRHALRPRRRADLGVHPGHAGPLRLRCSAPARRRPISARSAGSPGSRWCCPSGAMVLEEPRRPRAPGRRDRRLRGLSPPRDPARRDRIDSPWATQYNTWGFNPHQFPDAHGMISRMRADGRPDRRVGHGLGQPRLARRPDPAPAGLRAPARPAGPQLRAGGGRRLLRHRAAG